MTVGEGGLLRPGVPARGDGEVKLVDADCCCWGGVEGPGVVSAAAVDAREELDDVC
jgi:hypothetical protein